MSTELVPRKRTEPAVEGAFVPQVYELTFTQPDMQALLTPIVLDVQMVPMYEVDSDDLAEELQQMLGRIQTVRGVVENARLADKRPVLDLGKVVDEQYTPVFERLGQIINAGTAKLVAWAKVKREEAEARAAAAAEQRRKDAEAKAAEEAQALNDANAAVQKAQELRAAGSEQLADALESQAMVAVDQARSNAAAATEALHTGPVTVLPAAGKVKGQRSTWKAEVTNKSLFIQEVARRLAAGDQSLLDTLDVSQSAIDALARVAKQHMNYPGLRSYENTSIAVRRTAVTEPAGEPA